MFIKIIVFVCFETPFFFTRFVREIYYGVFLKRLGQKIVFTVLKVKCRLFFSNRYFDFR
jgi:hypothetical protein